MEKRMTGYETADVLQLAIARHYERDFGPSHVAIGNIPGADICFKDQKIEVKVDAMAAKTLNACIEYWDLKRNKPTGILQTEANLWLHCIPEGKGLRCFELDTKRLLRLCIEAGHVKTGGDFDSIVFKLIPMQEIKKIANTEFVLNGTLIDVARFW